ncbi:hypothetical protein K491DRAFT_152256 [Lophiostoma macrostomum CBS 122681]|uniref:Uncharacterized protein n=1 Tax=Lophiostoma macrostomum CBS 122681 TaxID=1314788 RepID=A0A6A6TI24_9PLEO|nr:hypothetical protein K491DRAFT_152256 [Lophiostoma macrostomum CBS 122681]
MCLSILFKGKKKSPEQHPGGKSREEGLDSMYIKTPPKTIDELLACTDNGVVFETSNFPDCPVAESPVFDDVNWKAKANPKRKLPMKIVRTALGDPQHNFGKMNLLHCRSFADVLKAGKNEEDKEYMYQPYWMEVEIGSREQCAQSHDYVNWNKTTKTQWKESLLGRNVDDFLANSELRLSKVERIFCVGDAFGCLGGQRNKKYALGHSNTLAHLLIAVYGAI